MVRTDSTDETRNGTWVATVDAIQPTPDAPIGRLSSEFTQTVNHEANYSFTGKNTLFWSDMCSGKGSNNPVFSDSAGTLKPAAFSAQRQ